MSQDDVERIFAKLEKRIAVELCSYGPNKPYDIGSNDGPNWMRYLPIATSVTKDARAALSAMPQRLSPELIAKLNALASRLTQMGEYDAVDLIDTVVARVTQPAHDKGEHQP